MTHSASYPIQWNGATDPGRFRKTNEDAFLALTFDAKVVQLLGKIGEANLDMGDFVFAVSDGMGGANAGEFGSRIAVDKIKELLPKSLGMLASGMPRGEHDILQELYDRIHREMVYMGQVYEECKGMGATLTMAWVSPGRISYAHIGDSRLYYLPHANPMRQATRDHSYVGALERMGKISAAQAKYHPKRHVINQAIGGNFHEAVPEFGVIEYEPGDRLLLCTDGVLQGCGPAMLEDKIRKTTAPDSHPSSSSSIAENIVKEARLNSGKDNATALVVYL